MKLTIIGIICRCHLFNEKKDINYSLFKKIDILCFWLLSFAKQYDFIFFRAFEDTCLYIYTIMTFKIEMNKGLRMFYLSVFKNLSLNQNLNSYLLNVCKDPFMMRAYNDPLKIGK